MDDFIIRPAEPADVPVIYTLIRELADYEHVLDQVKITETALHEWLFDKKTAEAVVGEVDGEPVGFALFYGLVSTFDGRAGIYLEDLFIRPAYRGRGYGRRIFQYLAALCRERGLGRLAWACLDWNTPSIRFYKQMGAVAADEWTLYNLDADGLDKLAGQA